jgi:hypothetical protein
MTRASGKLKAAAKAKLAATVKSNDSESAAIIELMRVDNKVALDHALASEALVAEL